MAVGAVANLVKTPVVAMLIGSAAGIISTLGYSHIQPLLLAKIRLHDTCGIHNLHGTNTPLLSKLKVITI